MDRDSEGRYPEPSERIPITGSYHDLPFERLSPPQLEQLCYWLAVSEGYEDVQHLGAAGRDRGQDVVAYHNGKRIAFQCKRVQSFRPSAAEKAVDKVRKLPAEKRPAELILVVTCNPTEECRDRAVERARPMRCTFWDRTALDKKTHDRPKVLERFFQLPEGPKAATPSRIVSPDDLRRTWLRHVAEAHDRLIPYFDLPDEPTLLHQVYVQLDLQVESAQHRAPPPDGERFHEALARPLDLRELLALGPKDHPWVTGRWVLLGDPGSGKTTILRHLAATLAREEHPRWIPVFASLPALMGSAEEILDQLTQPLARAGYPQAALGELLEEAGKDGRLALLLDGLDEVEKKDEAEVLLRALAQRWEKSPLVVTSRPVGYHRPGPGFRQADLLPIRRDRRRQFLAKWLGRGSNGEDETRADEALGVLEAEPSLWELAGNPLYLTLMALLFEQDEPPHRHRAQLYEQVFQLLMEGKHRPGGKAMPAQRAVRGALRHLAYGMTEAKHIGEPFAEVQDRLYQPAADPHRTRLERVARWREDLGVFLHDLAERTGILAPHDGEDRDWRFWHRTFREALTAERLYERWQKEGAEAVLAEARRIVETEEESPWAEPYALLAGHVGEPDALVKALVRANESLGLRALATAQNLEEETLAEVLKLTANWKERATVYRRVPELVGEAERALLLLERVREGTRNGNDLYFLDVAVQEVAQRWPEWASQAEAGRRGLYEHIPPPDPDLFQWVETPLDGRVPLWPAIPAGNFWMGSPEGEGHDDERPRHRVKFLGGFQIGAVPVTNAQYAAFDPGHEPERWEGVSEEELAHHPVVNVTWFEAVSFCRWLTTVDERFRGARLPTEEEWEYACRAGSEKRYWSGDGEEDLARVGWYHANSDRRTHRVGEKPANPWGLYDVHGNVWEWTVTPWDDHAYARRAKGMEVDPSQVEWEAETPTEPSGGDRVFRGGSAWDVADGARAAFRDFGFPGFRGGGQGFRVVLPGAPSR